MKDFEIIKAAKRSHPTLRDLTDGYIVKYDGEIFFIHTPGDGISIEECTIWAFDIEKHWCIEEYDPEFYTYYEVDGFMHPLALEGGY